jgi:hypothetical protein
MLLTRLPDHVLPHLRVLRSCFRYRQHLVFSWLLVLHLVYGDRANLKALARHGPAHLAYQHYRRLLCATYWYTKTLLWWFADQALQAFPPPEEGSLIWSATARSRAHGVPSIRSPRKRASASIIPLSSAFVSCC